MNSCPLYNLHLICIVVTVVHLFANYLAWIKPDQRQESTFCLCQVEVNGFGDWSWHDYLTLSQIATQYSFYVKICIHMYLPTKLWPFIRNITLPNNVKDLVTEVKSDHFKYNSDAMMPCHAIRRETQKNKNFFKNFSLRVFPHFLSILPAWILLVFFLTWIIIDDDYIWFDGGLDDVYFLRKNVNLKLIITTKILFKKIMWTRQMNWIQSEVYRIDKYFNLTDITCYNYNFNTV